MQAFLRAVLAVHGETLMGDEQLRKCAAALECQLAKSWGRLDTLLQSVHCMVNFLGSNPS